MKLCRTNSSGYETPWTAWGVEEEEEEKKQVGNIKLGPKNIRCPEDARASIKKFLFGHIQSVQSVKDSC